jgi:hypothetical protein
LSVHQACGPKAEHVMGELAGGEAVSYFLAQPASADVKDPQPQMHHPGVITNFRPAASVTKRKSLIY